MIGKNVNRILHNQKAHNVTTNKARTENHTIFIITGKKTDAVNAKTEIEETITDTIRMDRKLAQKPEDQKGTPKQVTASMAINAGANWGP